MVLLEQKIGGSHKFPYSGKNHHKKSEPSSASFRVFHSKVSNFINQILLKPKPGSEFLSLAHFTKCFDLISISNKAFAHMVIEMNHPLSKWGGKAIEEYLNYSFNLLDLLNSISSSISNLNQAKISILHALTENSPCSALDHLKKIPYKNLEKDFKLKIPIEMEEFKHGDETESMILRALMILKKTGFLALGFVLSGMCGDGKTYVEVRKSVEKSDDPMVKGLDSKFCEKITEVKLGVEEVKEVNRTVERLSSGRSNEHVEELKRKLEVMENLMEGLKKQGNDMFSQVLATRNNVVDNIRLTEKN